MSARTIIAVSAAAVLLASCKVYDVRPGDPLPAWRPGFLDIHSINSARGECTFYILPDGTTMCIDAGEMYRTASAKYPSAVPKPDSLTRPTDLYAAYMKHFMPGDSLDWFVLTHYHMDHMGKDSRDFPDAPEGGYRLFGPAAIDAAVPVCNLFDRSYPEYGDPIRLEDTSGSLAKYVPFVRYRVSKGMKAGVLQPGRDDQIVLRKDPEAYPDFKLTCLSNNGIAWNGNDTTDFHARRENVSSSSLLMSYGDFDWFTSGDNNGTDQIRCIIGGIGRKVEAIKCPHHMSNPDAVLALCKGLDPQVVVTQSFYVRTVQPHQDLIDSLAGKHDLFFTNVDSTLVASRPGLYSRCKDMNGHFVIRVLPGGDRYFVYKLKDTDFSNEVLAVYGPYECSGGPDGREPSCQFISHRGVDLDHTVAGENSLEAVALAARMGFQCIETDVRYSSDSVLVVMHDSSLNRTCLNADGTVIGEKTHVRDLTLRQLKEDYILDADRGDMRSRIPTLTEYLRCCKDNGLFVFIEPKLNDTTGRYYLDIMREADAVLGRGNYIITSNNFANGVIRRTLGVADVPLMGILYQTTFEDIESLGDCVMAISTSRFQPDEYAANVERAVAAGLRTESSGDDFTRFKMADDAAVDYFSTDFLCPDWHGQGRTVYDGPADAYESTESMTLGAMWLEMEYQGSATVTLGSQTFGLPASARPARIRHQLVVYDGKPGFSLSGASEDFKLLSSSLKVAEFEY